MSQMPFPQSSFDCFSLHSNKLLRPGGKEFHNLGTNKPIQLTYYFDLFVEKNK
jgi:hypothetical protein